MRGIYKWHGTRKGLRKKLMEINGGICYWCKNPCIEYPLPRPKIVQPDQATIDHVISRYKRKNGQVVLKVLACFRCNRLRAKHETREINRQLRTQL